MWYRNVAGKLFGLVTKHACDRQTDGQNYDSQDRASIAASHGNKMGHKMQNMATKQTYIPCHKKRPTYGFGTHEQILLFWQKCYR